MADQGVPLNRRSEPFLNRPLSAFSRFLFWVASRCPHWLFMYNRGILVRSEMPSARFRSYSQYSFSVAKHVDLEDIERLSHIPQHELQRRRLEGDWAYITRDLTDHQLVNILWVHQGKCFIKGFGLILDIDETEAYLYGGFTVPEARMKGLFDSSLYDVCSGLRSGGTKCFHALIEEWNVSSYCYHIRLGFKPIMKVVYLRVVLFKICCSYHLEKRKVKIALFVTRPADLRYI